MSIFGRPTALSRCRHCRKPNLTLSTCVGYHHSNYLRCCRSLTFPLVAPVLDIVALRGLGTLDLIAHLLIHRPLHPGTSLPDTFASKIVAVMDKYHTLSVHVSRVLQCLLCSFAVGTPMEYFLQRLLPENH